MGSLAYDVILWDWNGTLLDDGPYGLQIINRMLSRRSLPVPSFEEHGRFFDFPVRLYYERLGFDFSREPFEVISQEFVDAYIDGVTGCSLRSGTQEILALLSGMGFRQSILSASRQDYLERMVGHYGLKGYFEELLGIDSVHAPGKVGRGCEWMRESGLDPARVLLIGDTRHDAEVAGKMGVTCWLLEGGHHPAERLRRTGCSCFPNLDEIREALAAPVGFPSRV